jgi:hypothetical protein
MKESKVSGDGDGDDDDGGGGDGDDDEPRTRGTTGLMMNRASVMYYHV